MKVKNMVKRRITRSTCLIGLLCCFGCALSAQSDMHILGCGRSLAQLRDWVFDPGSLPAALSPVSGFRRLQTAALPFYPDSDVRQIHPPSLHVKWDVNDLPFFCRLEYRLDKKNRTPLKFRLGSVEYVDWLEGKPGALMPGF